MEASSRHQERVCVLCKGADPHTLIPIPYSIYSYSSLRRACIQGLLRPVLVTRPTSTTSRGDQYCFLLVTSTGSIADQYWSQSPSSEAPHNYLYTREVRPIRVRRYHPTQKEFKDSRENNMHILRTKPFQIQKDQISLHLSSLNLRRGDSISLPT